MSVLGRRPLPFVLAATNQGTLILNHLDLGVGWQLLARGAYDPNEVGTVVQLLDRLKTARGPGIAAIDCGANIGVHTITWARHMAGWGEVIAIEAQERIFYALAGNIALSNSFNARAIWAAVSDSGGTLMIPQPDDTQTASYCSLELLNSDTVENIGQAISYRPESLRAVTAMPIDSLELSRLDFIKIDVEGMEVQALNGARDSIARYRPFLFIEHIKAGLDALNNLLAELGYKSWDVGSNILAIPQEDPAADSFNIQVGSG